MVCEESRSLKLAFVSGLSDKKLTQKLLPLQALNEVEEIHLYRRRPYCGNKIHWMAIPRWAQKSPIVGDLLRFIMLLALGWRYDVLIGCHQSFHGLMAHMCSRIWKKPVIQVIIAEVDWIFKRPLLKSAVLSADACAVRGPVSCKRLRDLGYKGRIESLHNTYTLPTKVTNTPTVNRYYDFVAVGDFAEEKAYPWMMEVLGHVKKEWPGLKVAIVGRGPFRRKLGSLMSKNSLDEHVDFLGWKDEEALEEIYRSSRALLLTSSTEGLPMAVLEAMSCGLPVFVTDVGDLPWLVGDGKEGQVVPYGDTKGMSTAILNALKDSDLLERMGENGYARIVSLSHQFNTEEISKTWFGLLSSVLGKGCTFNLSSQ